MSQPPGFVSYKFPKHVCKLNKAFCGLKQATHEWFHKLSNALLYQGFNSSRANSSMFVYVNGRYMTVILAQVDDIKVTNSNSSQIRQLISHLDLYFGLNDLGDLRYFLGLEVKKFGS